MRSDASELLWPVYERVRDADRSRLAMLTQHARLYGNRNLDALAPGSYDARGNIAEDVLKFNLCRSVVDTVVAKVGKQRPRPIFVTDGGKWSEQQKAKGLSRAVYGEFYRSKFYDVLPIIVRDAAVGGSGILKIFADGNNKIKIERVYAWELFVDAADGWYGAPRSLYQRKAIDRTILAEQFPDEATAIENASSKAPAELAGTEYTVDRLEVVEAWHLPSSDKAKDGRHVIAISGTTLLDEPYTRETFPFAFMHYSHPIAGFWGTSLLDDIKSQQFEMNALLEKKQEMISLNVPRTYVNRSAKLSKNHMSNVPGEIVEYTGLQAPQHIAPSALSPEYSVHEAQVKQDAYEQAGVSQLSASSRKPAGLDAGVALREYNDIETERFSIVSRSVESFSLSVAALVVEGIRELVAAHGTYTIQAMDEKGRSAAVIDWASVDLDANSYVMQASPVSLLPSRPEAKLQRVTEMLAAGMISQVDAARLLDFPDLEAVTSRTQAPYDLVDKAIDAMLTHGQEVTPEPFWPLQYAIETMTQTYCQTGYMAEGPPPENRDLLRTCILLCERLTSQAAAAQAQAQAPQGAPAQAVPVA